MQYIFFGIYHINIFFHPAYITYEGEIISECKIFDYHSMINIPFKSHILTSLSKIQFEQRMVDKKDSSGFQRVYLDDVLSDDERMLRIEAIADPNSQTPEQIYIQKEQLTELYAALDKLLPENRPICCTAMVLPMESSSR